MVLMVEDFRKLTNEVLREYAYAEGQPTCDVLGCESIAMRTGTVTKFGEAWRRSLWIPKKYGWHLFGYCCSSCHGKHTAANRGVKNIQQVRMLNAGVDITNREAVERWYYDYDIARAKREGCSIADLNNKNHRYLKHRKDYCENVDGQMGFACGCAGKAREPEREVHHKVEQQFGGTDHPDNLITLCANCHRIVHTRHWKYEIMPSLPELVVLPTMQVENFDESTYTKNRPSTIPVFNPGYEWSSAA
jgi:hypothetical protein